MKKKKPELQVEGWASQPYWFAWDYVTAMPKLPPGQQGRVVTKKESNE